MKTIKDPRQNIGAHPIGVFKDQRENKFLLTDSAQIGRKQTISEQNP